MSIPSLVHRGERAGPCGFAEGWCWWCYANRRGRGQFAGHRWYVSPLRSRRPTVSEWIERSKRGPTGQSVNVTPEERAWVASHPALHEYMSLPRWADGSVRETATLIIFVDDLVYKACLNDRATGKVGFVTAATPLTLFELLEERLQTDSMDWRAAKVNKGRR